MNVKELIENTDYRNEDWQRYVDQLLKNDKYYCWLKNNMGVGDDAADPCHPRHGSKTETFYAMVGLELQRSLQLDPIKEEDYMDDDGVVDKWGIYTSEYNERLKESVKAAAAITVLEEYLPNDICKLLNFKIKNFVTICDNDQEVYTGSNFI